MYDDDDTLTGLEQAGRARQHRFGRSLSSRGAIYHLNARTGSRSKGHSARAAAAYIQRTAEYGREPAAELLFTASGHLPAWAEADPTTYWAAADLHERANGRLFKRLEFALPTALTTDEQCALALGFARHLTAGEHLPYTLAIHAGNGTNPHCHLLISERINDGLERSPAQWFKRYNPAHPERGGARKTEALKPKAWLAATRAAWAAQTNAALARAGHEVRIDHRSLAAQGITDRLPGVHLGPTAQAMEVRGLATERGAEARRRARVTTELAALTAQLAELDAAAPRLFPPPPSDPPPAQIGPEPAPRGADRALSARETLEFIAAHPAQVAAQVAALKDPEARAKAARLLATIQREAAARERSNAQTPARGRGRDEDLER